MRWKKIEESIRFITRQNKIITGEQKITFNLKYFHLGHVQKNLFRARKSIYLYPLNLGSEGNFLDFFFHLDMY
jgi:hypothetical protein